MTKNIHDETYRDILRRIICFGNVKEDRTGTGTISYTDGFSKVFDLRNGFPLLTCKKTLFRLIASELLWFLRGGTNVRELHEMDNHIWDEWAREDGSLGPIYGSQWREFRWQYLLIRSRPIDQIARLVENLKSDPFGRRHVVSAWNPLHLDDMALPPCHLMFNCTVDIEEDELVLNLNFVMRSTDVFLGLPFNIASYALLLLLLAKQCDMRPGKLIYTCIGDAHIYLNHNEQVDEVLRTETYPAPEVEILSKPDLINMKWEDGSPILYEHFGFELPTSKEVHSYKGGSEPRIVLKGYRSAPYIKAPISV